MNKEKHFMVEDDNPMVDTFSDTKSINKKNTRHLRDITGHSQIIKIAKSGGKDGLD